MITLTAAPTMSLAQSALTILAASKAHRPATHTGGFGSGGGNNKADLQWRVRVCTWACVGPVMHVCSRLGRVAVWVWVVLGIGGRWGRR